MFRQVNPWAGMVVGSLVGVTVAMALTWSSWLELKAAQAGQTGVTGDAGAGLIVLAVSAGIVVASVLYLRGAALAACAAVVVIAASVPYLFAGPLDWPLGAIRVVLAAGHSSPLRFAAVVLLASTVLHSSVFTRVRLEDREGLG